MPGRSRAGTNACTALRGRSRQPPARCVVGCAPRAQHRTPRKQAAVRTNTRQHLTSASALKSQQLTGTTFGMQPPELPLCAQVEGRLTCVTGASVSIKTSEDTLADQPEIRRSEVALRVQFGAKPQRQPHEAPTPQPTLVPASPSASPPAPPLPSPTPPSPAHPPPPPSPPSPPAPPPPFRE